MNILRPIAIAIALALPMAIFSFVPHTSAKGVDPEERVEYYLYDHLGGVDAVLDEQGNVVERRDYLPFGEKRVNEATGIDKERHGFTGKELDDESGLYYYGSRYYDPTIGRFLSQDPVLMGEAIAPSKDIASLISDPQLLNSYSYVRNNPLAYTDPNGEFLEALIGAITTLLLTPETAYAPDEAMGNAIARGDIKSEKPNTISTAIMVAAGEKAVMSLVNFAIDISKRFQNYGKEVAEPGRIGATVENGEDYKNSWNDPSKAEDHFARHGKKEFGFESPEEYTEKAKEFFNNKGAEKVVTKNGDIQLYDTKTNTFGAYKPDGSIKTFMKPTSGEKYFETQISKSKLN